MSLFFSYLIIQLFYGIRIMSLHYIDYIALICYIFIALLS